jgi:multidrug resistance efflux pump
MKENGIMNKDQRSRSRRILRVGDRLFDGIGMRPTGLLVLAGSFAFLLFTIDLSTYAIRAEAVAIANSVDHPSRVASFVTRTFVRPGDRVDVGAPLVELSAHFLDQDLNRIDLKIEQLISESQLDQARLLVEEERWVQPGLRQRPNRPSLEAPMASYYEKQIEFAQARRGELLAARGNLVIKASFAGIVSEVTRVGESIGEGSSVASVTPEFAEEVVAYVSPRTDPRAVAIGESAYIMGPMGCTDPGRVRARGANVEKAPPQLKQLINDPLHGTPIHVDIPADCQLSNGQILDVEFRHEQQS